MTKPTYSIEPELVKPFCGKSRVVFNLVKSYEYWDDPSYGGGEYRTVKKVLDVYRTKWEAEEVVKLLNDLTGEM